MKWYVAEIIVRCRVGKARRRKLLYDRQIKLLQAANHEAAYKRALRLGEIENHRYKNSAGETVYWEFIGLADLDTLLTGKIEDGTTVHSRLRRGDPKSEVHAKQNLTVFWSEHNKHKTAAELLNNETKSVAPC
jgi:hypothetical protein